MTKPNPLPTRDWPNGIEDPVYFTNRQWAVTGWGLECLDPESEYEWPADRLRETHRSADGETSATLDHIGGKTWVDAEALIEAYRKALEIHHPGADLRFDLAEDERWLRQRKAEDGGQ